MTTPEGRALDSAEPPRTIEVEVLAIRDVIAAGPPDSSPLLHGYGGVLRWAGPLTHRDVRAIKARVEYGELPWWSRWPRRRPEGW